MEYLLSENKQLKASKEEGSGKQHRIENNGLCIFTIPPPAGKVEGQECFLELVNAYKSDSSAEPAKISKLKGTITILDNINSDSSEKKEVIQFTSKKYVGKIPGSFFSTVQTPENTNMPAKDLPGEHSLKQCEILARLHHKNLENVKGIIFTSATKGEKIPRCLLMKVADGNLNHVVNWCKAQKKAVPIKKISLDILRGLEYIHSQNLIHGRLCPENILFFNAKFQFKISDLRVAGKAREAGTFGNKNYAAPEWFEQGCTLDFGSDLFSFGLIFIELLLQQKITPENRTHLLMTATTNFPRCTTLLAGCFAKNPTARISTSDAIRALNLIH